MSKSNFTITDLFGNKVKYLVYPLNNKPVERRSSAPTKEQINNDPAFHNVKMNNYEFGAAAILGKAIRSQHILPVYTTFKDTFMASRLTGVCRSIIKKGSGALGSREACLVSNGKPLVQFPYNQNRPLSYSFQAKYVIQTTPKRDHITLHTQIAKKYLSGQPKNATHVQLTLAVVTVSKYTFNKKTKSYQPKHPKQNSLGAYTHSNPIPITTNDIPVTIALQVPATEPLANTTAIVVSLGITFGNIENNSFQSFLTANAMNMIEIL